MSGPLTVIAVLGAATAIGAGSVLVGQASMAAQRAAGAADMAALAAADAASGAIEGIPCAVADEVARANGTELAGCELDRTTATITVRTHLILPITARARAGPAAASK